jgi:hypothetical protein
MYMGLLLKTLNKKTIFIIKSVPVECKKKNNKNCVTSLIYFQGYSLIERAFGEPTILSLIQMNG